MSVLFLEIICTFLQVFFFTFIATTLYNLQRAENVIVRAFLYLFLQHNKT